jgi:hypothetical protein
VIIGLLAGRAIPSSQAGNAQESGIVPSPQVTVTAPQRISDQELQNLSVSNVQLVPDAPTGSPTVVVHLRTLKPLEIEGDAGDADVKRVLSYVISSGQKFEPDVRLDSVEVLRSRASDADVRSVLCQAALKDPNASVRVNALEALQGANEDPDVRDALLQVLVHDPNPGVRIVAINQLRGAVETGHASDDSRVRELLQTLSKHDANGYVRVQAAAAVRHLNSSSPQQ